MMYVELSFHLQPTSNKQKREKEVHHLVVLYYSLLHENSIAVITTKSKLEICLNRAFITSLCVTKL